MEIKESRKVLFSDTQIPNIFITEYLSLLSELAVKTYLLSLFVVKEN